MLSDLCLTQAPSRPRVQASATACIYHVKEPYWQAHVSPSALDLNYKLIFLAALHQQVLAVQNVLLSKQLVLLNGIVV